VGAGISAKALDGRLRRAAKRLLKNLTAIGLVNGAVSGTGERRQVQGVLEGLPLEAGWRILRASNGEIFAWPWVRWGAAPSRQIYPPPPGSEQAVLAGLAAALRATRDALRASIVSAPYSPAAGRALEAATKALCDYEALPRG
jgi:hypothetical protein